MPRRSSPRPRISTTASKLVAAAAAAEWKQSELWCDCLSVFLFLQDLPDVQELIAEVSAEKYSLQAAAILGEFARELPARLFVSAASVLVCVTLTSAFRHR